MLQKTKSMLIKLLMLLCVVCCAVALAFSLAACSGVTVERMEVNSEGHLIVYYSDGTQADLGLIGGETETSKTVVDVSVVGDTVTVTYSDGSSEEFTITNGEDDACDHANVETVMLTSDWDCAVGGQVLEVCSDCGYTQIVDVAPGHVYESTVVAPTCMSEGYTVDTCIYCGEEAEAKTDITPATGVHVYAEQGYEVANLGSTLCQGGWVVYPCEYGCGYVEFEELAPKGHEVGEVTVEKVPNGNEDGTASAFCNACGEQITVTLPALTTANLSKYTYEITDEEVNCSANMDAHFTYVDEESGLTVEFDGVLPGGQHKLNGEVIDDTQVITYNGPESLPEGMEIAGNSNGVVNCTTEGVYAVFTCDDCGRLIVVNVRVPHTKPADATVVNDETDMSEQRMTDAATNQTTVYTYAAACGSSAHEGYEIYYCSVCDTVVKDVIPVPDHEWTNYSAVEGKDPDTQEDILTVSRECENCGQKDSFTLKNYTITEVKPTCQEEGTITYSGTYEGEAITVVQVVPATPHIHAEYGELDDSKVYNVSDYPNIEVSGNSTETCVDDEVYGVFTCTQCGQPIVLNMQYPHTEPTVEGKVVEETSTDVDSAQTSAADDHTKVFVVAADCDTAGARVFYCSVCEKVVTVNIPALGHKYVDKLTYNEMDDNWDYVRECSVCGDKAAEDLDILNYNAETAPNGVRVIATSASTCDKPATTTYQYTSEETGAVVTVVIEGTKAMHTLNGVLVDDEAYFDPAVTAGITPSGNYDLTCAGEGGLGVFTCEVCGKPIVVKIRDAHTVPSTVATELPEEFVGGWEAIVDANEDGVVDSTPTGLATNVYYTQAATCTDAGKYVYYCAVCQQWITGTTVATGHNYAYVGYTWDDEALKFTVTFECTNANCQAAPAEIELTPFTADGSALTLADGYTLVSFNAPTHNTYGNFTVKYTIKAANFTPDTVAADFEYEVTLAGGLQRGVVGDMHFHVTVAPVAPVDPDEPVIVSGDGNFYWFVDTTNAETEEVTRTYYVATICEDCGEMYMVSATAYTGEDIPESDLPAYAWAVAADEEAAAEEAAA